MTNEQAADILERIREETISTRRRDALHVAILTLTRMSSMPLAMFGDDLKRLRSITANCRPDMHEPDEQGLRAEFGPTVRVCYARTPGSPAKSYPVYPNLDNANTGEDGDLGFWLVLGDEHDQRREWFNLADIIALARREP